MAGKRRSCTSTITRVVPSRASVIGCVAGMRVSLGNGSEATVETAVLDGLGHVLRDYPLTSGQVRDSAGHLENTIVAPGGKAKTAHRLLKKLRRLRWRRAESPHLPAAHAGVDARAGAGQALRLTAARHLDPRPDRLRRLSASPRELGVGDGPHLEMQIDPGPDVVWWGARKGLSRTSPCPAESRPATLHTAVISIASSRARGGRRVPRRRASMVLPAPGGPSISRLCPPAAAISRARLAQTCPRTSERSSPSVSRFAFQPAAPDRCGEISRSPFRYSRAS